MHIEELHIQNFRGLKELTVKLPKNLAVIIGENGSGKSSILDCIAMLLAQFEARLTGVNKLGPLQVYLTERDIHTTSDRTTNSLTLLTDSQEKLNWSISRERFSKGQKSQTQELKRYAQRVQQRLQETPNASLPILAYYQSSRTLISSAHFFTKTTTNPQHPQFNAYKNAFTFKANNFQDFFTWFRAEEDYENEIRLRQDNSYRNPNLALVRAAISLFLEEFSNSHLSNLRVKRASSDRDFNFASQSTEASFVITKDDQELEVEQLSDGEKTLLMLIVDIARRLAIANPQLGIEALQGGGIVLIDEVDLHLHPQWQRLLIPSLTKTFSQCQFIVTTHSPQVLSKVERENVFIVEDGQTWQADSYTFGRDSNSILSELMGVEERPVEIRNKLNQCFYLIDDGRIEEARLLLQELSNLLGERDSEVVRAYTLIDFLSRIEPEPYEANC